MDGESSTTRSRSLIYGAIYELGVDVECFALPGAARRDSYVSGVDIAMLAGLAIVYRFLSGVAAGASERAARHGERLGAAAIDAVADVVSTLGRRAQQALTSPRAEDEFDPHQAETELDALLDGDLRALRALVTDDDVARASDEIADLLRRNGFPEARVDTLAARLAKRLLEEW